MKESLDYLSKTGVRFPPPPPPEKIKTFSEKIKIDGNKTVYFDTISTDLNNLNLQSSLTYWRLKKYKSGGSVRTARGELQTDMTSSEVD